MVAGSEAAAQEAAREGVGMAAGRVEVARAPARAAVGMAALREAAVLVVATSAEVKEEASARADR